MSSILRVVLTAERVGQRVDRALVEALAEQGHAITRSQLSRSFAAGRVLLDGRALKPAYKLEHTCELELELLEPAPLVHAFAEDIPLAIVHEDADLLVIDKPAGMVVHAGPGHERGTLVNAVLHHLGRERTQLPVLPGNGPERPGIVHRLDRDTSGLIVVAKTLPALANLSDQLRAHTIDRAYLGVVLGDPRFETRRVETRHGRDPVDRRRFAPDQGERRAITTMMVVQRLGAQPDGTHLAALVRFELETGRTHQIRMHARHVGHPIFADPLYGHRPRTPELRALADGLGRHALHAALLGFDHPSTGRRMQFESPLPRELADLVARIGE